MIQPHVPVLFEESINYLVTDSSGAYFDATVGFGGHLSGILAKLDQTGVVVGCDVDDTAFSTARTAFESDPRVRIYQLNFAKIDVITKLENLQGYQGIIADLGVSSYQLDSKEAGISFKENARLDMRLDKTLPETAEDVLNTMDEAVLKKIFYEYGEEQNAKKIVRKILAAREEKRLCFASDIESIIKGLVPQRYIKKTMQRVFQALRIYVNDELGNLQSFLEKAVDLLLPGGRIVVLSYHSLEDRMVKEIFKYEERSCICPPEFPVCRCSKQRRLTILTKKPETPSFEEIKRNYRSRSAKLRVAEKL